MDRKKSRPQAKGTKPQPTHGSKRQNQVCALGFFKNQGLALGHEKTPNVSPRGGEKLNVCQG
jgi:hypothetical protein